jgi:hypothetical protein
MNTAVRSPSRPSVAFLLILPMLAPAVALGAGEQLDRSVYAVGGGTSGAAGQIMEMTIGQIVSAKLESSANKSFSGYLNTNHRPGTVTTLVAVAGSSEGEADLTWTAPSGDGILPTVTATGYILRFSTSVITSQTLFEAAQTRTIPAPAAPGASESYTLTGLTPGLTYYIAIEARDAAQNQASLSNQAGNSAIIFATPPAEINDLVAATGAGGGEIALTWTSPGDDGTTGNLAPGVFRIDYSTDNGHSFTPEIFQLQIATNATALSAQSRIVAGLLGNATYYLSVFTGDDIPSFSTASNVASALTRAYAPGAAGFSDISTFSFRANWLANNNAAGTEYRAELSTDPAFSVLLSSSGFITTFSHVFSGLSVGQTYYARVKARNAALLETSYTLLGTEGTGALTVPFGIAPPVNISVASDDRRLTLSWTPVTTGSPDSVRIRRSTASAGPYSVVATIAVASTTYVDAGLVNGDTYYYVLSSLSGGSESSASSQVAGVPRDGVPPFAVAGVERLFQPEFLVQWRPVLVNANATMIHDLKGYRIYRTGGFRDEPVLVAEVTAGINSLSVSGPAALSGFYYFVRAFDTSGNESLDSLWVRNSPRLELFGVSPDRRWRAEISEKGASSLFAEGNTKSSDIVLFWSRHPSEESGRVVATDSLVAYSASNGGPVADFEFRRLGVELAFDLQTAAAAANPALLAAEAGSTANQYAVFWHNGVEYVKFGGDMGSDGVLRVQSRATGKFQVRRSLRATEFTVLQTAPRKIFTPNGDGVNDVFEVYFENPLDSAISHAKIFDIKGAEVSDFQLGLSGDSLLWDGRGHDGRIARGGVYIFQIESEGKTFNGTIVLAK